ncbi:MAG: hypothetical protein K2I90_06340 [Odoribacter sp.]|nr:hypothetical protein [Odoribacter sp.]
MKIWKLISVLLLACLAGACDDDFAGKENDADAVGQAKVSFGYEAKTVLKNGDQVLVPVCLDAPVRNAVKVTFSVLQGDEQTAREGIDFDLPDKVVTIPAGDTVAYLAVDQLDDRKTDNDREIKLNIAGVYGAGMGEQKSVSLYVVSNAFVEFEKATWETYESANVETSSEEIKHTRFVPLTITGNLREAVTIVLEVQDSSAIEPTHFTVEKEVSVAPGATQVNVEIKPVDDIEMNEDRVFILKIKEVRGGNLLVGKTNASCEVKILSEEILRTLSWGIVSQSKVDEEGILDIPVYLDKIPLASFTADIIAVGPTDAVEGVDYEILTPQIEMTSARQATVQVKILRNPEVNANRVLVLNFNKITDETVFASTSARAFTLTIQNSDFPSFEGATLEAIEDEENEVVISIPAVDRERTLTLEYSTTEQTPGTYFETPSTTLTVPAGATEVRLPLQVKYTLDFPTVVPALTASIVKVDDVPLENVNTKLILTPCHYRKLLGTWKLYSDAPDSMSEGDITVSMGEFKKGYRCTTESRFCTNVASPLKWNMSYDSATGRIQVVMGEQTNVDTYDGMWVTWYYYGNMNTKAIDTEWEGDDRLNWLSGGNYVCVAFINDDGSWRGQGGWHQTNVRMVRQ